MNGAQVEICITGAGPQGLSGANSSAEHGHADQYGAAESRRFDPLGS